MMRGQQQVYDYLDSHNIEYEYFEHPESPTIEIALKYYRGEDTTLCKNLFFRNHKGNKHYLVILDALSEMDIHAIEKLLHQGKLSFASEERMMRYLGVKPGSVSLFTLINNIEHDVIVFIDNALRNANKVSFHPNDCTASLVIRNEDMVKFLNGIGNEWKYMDVEKE